MYYVYVLFLKNGEYYVGSTPDLRNRIKEHKLGYCLSTKNLRPVKLIFYASFEDKKKSLSFERYLKTASGKAFRNKRLI